MVVKQSISPKLISVIIPVLLKGLAIGTIALPLIAPIAQAQTVSTRGWSNTPDSVIALRRAIIGQESNANFRAVNRHSGALGYGQIMPENLPQWSREALGYAVSRDDFLNNPTLQLQVIEYKLYQYWVDAMAATRGNETVAVLQVASRWYSGNPYRYNSTTPQYYGGHRYPSISEYSLSVLQRYQQEFSYWGMNQPQMQPVNSTY